MNLIEIMKAKGISDDIIKAVQEDMKANKIFTSAEENIDIRYGKLKTEHEAVVKERDEGKALIESLQKSSKGNEGLQKQLTEYQTKMEQLQAELQQTKIDSAINVVCWQQVSNLMMWTM
jgi:seryl-tRNA synthetase